MYSIDHLITAFDKTLRAITGVTMASRPSPAIHMPDAVLNEQERNHSIGLMRINHVGEVCAQALYDAQARMTKDAQLRTQFQEAGQEEEDHLAWTAQRLTELGSQPSLLNPLWYAGSYAIGSIAALLGDKHSLGFVVETERQVENHLTSHLDSLPTQDAKSRAIIEQMRLDEIEHGAAAQARGAADVPKPVQLLMTAMSKVMTTTAYRI